MKPGAGRGYDTISFLSDYGHGDEFVGVVHSVIAAIAPHVRVVDVTHGIAPCNVRAGGLALARAAQYLLPGVVLGRASRRQSQFVPRAHSESRVTKPASRVRET